MSEKRLQLRQRRIFSEVVKRHIVEQIELGKLSVARASRENGVGITSIYNWLHKYSRHLQGGKTLVVQMDSEATKTQALQKRILELEAALGRKQMEVDFLNKMIEIGKDELGVDLKKKRFTPPSTGSGTTPDNTTTD